MRITIHRKNYFFAGLGIILLMFFLYLIKIDVDSGANYIIKDSMLGIIIFHNPFILGLYILAAITLIVKGISK